MKDLERVTFTQDEAQWFSRNVVKMKQLLEISSRKDKGVLERSTYKVLTSMTKKAETLDLTNESVEVLLNRKHKIVLRDLIGSVLKNLVTRVIPEYERRGDSHKEYLENAKDKAIRLEKMTRKLK